MPLKKLLKPFGLLLAVFFSINTISTAQAAWTSLTDVKLGQRHIWVDGLKHDLINTGDTVRVGSTSASTESKEVLFIIFSHDKTAILFKDKFLKNHTKPTLGIMSNSFQHPQAQGNLKNFGLAYGDRKLTKTIKSGSNKVWIGRRLYKSLKTGDEIEFASGNTKTTKTVKHVIAHKGATMLVFKKPFTSALNRAQVTKADNTDTIEDLLAGIADKGTNTGGRTTGSTSSSSNSSNTTSSSGTTSSSTTTPSTSTNTEIHAISIYEGSSNHSGGNHPLSTVNVEVKNTGKPIILSLNSYEPVNWNLSLASGANIQEVLLTGYHKQTLAGLPSNVPLKTYSYEEKNYNSKFNQFGKKLTADSDQMTLLTDNLQALLKSSGKVHYQSIYNGSKGFVIPEGSTTTPVAPAAIGSLSIEAGSTVFSDILVANQTDVEILNIRLSSTEDEIQVKDLNFKASDPAAADRVKFKLYNDQGQLAQSQSAFNGALEFKLSDANRIRVPKNGSTVVSIRVDVRDINDVSQTGKILNLSLDTAQVQNGVVALSAATGATLPKTKIKSSAIKSQDFLIAKSQLTLRHAVTQPRFADPSSSEQEFYRFTATADAAGDVELATVSFNVALQGMTYQATPKYRVLAVKSDGTLDTTSKIINSTKSTTIKGGEQQDLVFIHFQNQIIKAGESRTYALLFNNTQNTQAGENDDDAVAITFRYDRAPAGPGSVLSTNGSIVWSDKSGTNSFFNGYLLDIDTTAHVNND